MKTFIAGAILTGIGFAAGFAACELAMCSVISKAADGEEDARSTICKLLLVGDKMRGVLPEN